MDALGLDVEETKGENLRGSGYWEAPRKMPDETGTAAAAAPAEGSRNYGAELDELRREVAALRREGHKGVSVASTDVAVTVAIRTVRRRAPSATRPIRSVRRGRSRSCPAPCTRTSARDCPRRSPSTLATARTRALLSGKS